MWSPNRACGLTSAAAGHAKAAAARRATKRGRVMRGTSPQEGHGRAGFVPYRNPDPGATAGLIIPGPRGRPKDSLMKIRLTAALALAVGAVSLSAQEPNPYAKAKVGDYAVYKTS